MTGEPVFFSYAAVMAWQKSSCWEQATVKLPFAPAPEESSAPGGAEQPDSARAEATIAVSAVGAVNIERMRIFEPSRSDDGCGNAFTGECSTDPWVHQRNSKELEVCVLVLPAGGRGIVPISGFACAAAVGEDLARLCEGPAVLWVLLRCGRFPPRSAS